MAIIESNETESRNVSGFKKGIEASAESMMLDNLQVFMYQKPIQSTVRECTSNALDAVKEKKIAIEILRGDSKVSDYFIEKEGDIYKDSEFDHKYYDLNWLSTKDEVKLTYINNSDALGRDMFIIEDTGVGLGNIRLEKYFSLGYSSKRLTSQTLGAFGLGNKSPLSTGVESYRIISRYNGMEFCFDVFSHKVDCVYSKWGDDGQMNDYYEFKTVSVETPDGPKPYKAYYKKTEEKNGLTIQLEVKKHNKSGFFEAVRSQLMYFKENITFTEKRDEAGVPNNIPFKSTIIFENDDIILSDSNYFSRPHFVLKNVVYGAVDFRELELENRHGSVGIKVNMEEIDVSPSRESIIYNTKTKNVITEKYNRIATAVTGMINKNTTSGDFLAWIRSCNAIFYNNTSNSSDAVLYRLSGMIDKFALTLEHTQSGSKYVSDITQFVPKFLKTESVFINRVYDYKTRAYKNNVKRTAGSNLSMFNKPIFMQFSTGSNKTTKYLLDVNPDGFSIIKPNSGYDFLDDLYTQLVYKKLDYRTVVEQGVKFIISLTEPEDKKMSVNSHFMKTAKFISNLLNSKDVSIYDENSVPADYVFTDDEDLPDDIEEVANKKKYKKILSERKAQGKFIIGLCADSSNSNSDKFTYSNMEVDTSQFKDDDNVVYGYNEDVEALTFFARMNKLRLGNVRLNNRNVAGWNDEIKICRIAKNNKKFLADKTHVSDYVVQYQDGNLTTTADLKKHLNVELIQKNLNNSEFFINFGLFDSSLKDTYQELSNYSRSFKTYRFPGTEAFVLLKKAAEFQLFKFKHPEADPDLIDKMGLDLLGMDIFDSIDDVDLLDRDLYDKIISLNKFAEVYGSMFNNISALRTIGAKISEDLERDIKAFIAIKQDQLELEYPNLNY